MVGGPRLSGRIVDRQNAAGDWRSLWLINGKGAHRRANAPWIERSPSLTIRTRCSDAQVNRVGDACRARFCFAPVSVTTRESTAIGATKGGVLCRRQREEAQERDVSDPALVRGLPHGVRPTGVAHVPRDSCLRGVVIRV